LASIAQRIAHRRRGLDGVSSSGAANAPFLPASGSTVEAQKTEPDKNTYLVLESAGRQRSRGGSWRAKA
jgi:hypothetical protein